MIKRNISEMTLGWFVGDFSPSILQTDKFEVAYKDYKEGDFEEKHVHKIAKEITLIVKGKARMNGEIYSTGDIILLNPGEPTDFEALEDTSTVVVKTPSVTNDKYKV